jgi:hypothetical protein
LGSSIEWIKSIFQDHQQVLVTVTQKAIYQLLHKVVYKIFKVY